MSRIHAEVLLYGQDNGVFLIRDSNYFRGYLTLSCITNGKILHFLIARNKEMLSIDYSNWFNTLNDLVIVNVKKLAFILKFLTFILFSFIN